MPTLLKTTNSLGVPGVIARGKYSEQQEIVLIHKTVLIPALAEFYFIYLFFFAIVVHDMTVSVIYRCPKEF